MTQCVINHSIIWSILGTTLLQHYSTCETLETEEAVGRKAKHVYYMVPLCWCLINKWMCFMSRVHAPQWPLWCIFIFLFLNMCTCSFVPLHDHGLNYHLDTLHLHSTWKKYVIITTILYGIQIILVFRIIFQRHLLWSRTGVLGNCGPFTVWVSKLCYAATFPQHRRCNVLMTWGKKVQRLGVFWKKQR